jgi:ankyrin repeat protein
MMDICRAARIGTFFQVQKALDNGADINYQDATYGRTPLSWAVANKNEGVVRRLLREDGIDLNSKANDGRTPLSCAVAVRGNQEVVELLLGEDDIDLNSKDNDGRTPLSWAVAETGNQEVVELLLREDDIDLDSKDNDGRTPLSWAVAERGNQEVVDLLLKRGSSINFQDHNGRTPLSWAVTVDTNKGVVQRLLREDGIDLNSKDNDGRIPLWWAVERGNQEVVEMLLKKGSITFHTLVRDGQKSLVQRFLDAKYDVNTRDPLGKTPLHIAISSRNVEMALVLISFNATDINLKDNDGITPLRLAARMECPDIIKAPDVIEALLKKSALTKDIMAHEWRKAYRRQASDIVILSEQEDRVNSVCFIAADEFLDQSAQVGTDRRLL